MPELYPLRFQPIFRRYIWGGTRLGTLLNKPVGDEPRCAESWEVCDHDEDQGVVSAGPLEGRTLASLVAQHGEALLGMHAPLARFPLLVKFLDSAQPLSVQVHPNDARAARLEPPDLGKTEAWVVLDCEPGSVIYAGLKRGFDREALQRELVRGTAELCLHRFEPQVGDCLFIPAGTVHALGAGLLVAEIQQASDTTYRLFDWNRLGADGKPRTLHIEAGLEAVDYQRGPVNPQTPQPTGLAHIEQLVSCDKFVLNRWELERHERIGGDNRFHVLAVLEGEVEISGDPSQSPLQKGGSVLLPAQTESAMLTPKGRCVLLEAHLP